MCDVPIFFATTAGQTRLIAERLASRMREHGLDARAIEIDSPESHTIDWTRVCAAGVGASLHMQRHQRRALAFARAHAAELSARPSVFFSVSLAAASKNPEEVLAAQQLAQAFVRDAGWAPHRVASIAGRLAYTQYGWLVRWLIRRIAIKEGGSGDTSRDHEYTDWVQVRDLADALVAEIRRVGRRRGRLASDRQTAAPDTTSVA